MFDHNPADFNPCATCVGGMAALSLARRTAAFVNFRDEEQRSAPDVRPCEARDCWQDAREGAKS